MNYKNAFNCKKCPQCNTEEGCPAWMELVTVESDGKHGFRKDCSYVLLPQIIIRNSAASDRVTENLSALPHRFSEELKNRIQVVKTLSVDRNG